MHAHHGGYHSPEQRKQYREQQEKLERELFEDFIREEESKLRDKNGYPVKVK